MVFYVDSRQVKMPFRLGQELKLHYCTWLLIAKISEKYNYFTQDTGVRYLGVHKPYSSSCIRMPIPGTHLQSQVAPNRHCAAFCTTMAWCGFFLHDADRLLLCTAVYLWEMPDWQELVKKKILKGKKNGQKFGVGK